jgi:hypothetical protein
MGDASVQHTWLSASAGGGDAFGLIVHSGRVEAMSIVSALFVGEWSASG